ncbi:hypothetical protein ACLB2K_054523 [Fragaria x ananassa]
MERKSEKSKGDYDWEDRITVLPDDLLSMIVHPLPIKEAAAAAILSKRWKSTTNLNFFGEGVDVTGEVLEYFMSNCAALERLTVNAAHNLVS